MLALDELCEEAIRARMEVLALAGDRLSALKVFEQWRLKLHEELSANPSESIVVMATQLRRRGWEAAPVSDLPSPPHDQSRGRTFIGRWMEYRFLYEAWEDVRAGRRGHAMVLGDSGIGKTTLVERFTTTACLEGAALSRVQCYDLDREIPYATIAGLVIGLLERGEASGTPPEALAELSRIVPLVRQRFSSIPQPRESQGETARIEFTESFHQLLDALTEERPVILVVDDLHLADDASLEVIHLLIRRELDQRVMLILIGRPGELTLARQARRFREAATTLGIRELELLPLSESEGFELLASLLESSATSPPLSVRKALVEAAAGFPMVLELLCQDWRSTGGYPLGLALEAMTADLAAKRQRVRAYHKLVDNIMRAIDPATRSVLQVASILGPRLNDLALYEIASLSLGQTMAGLAQLTEFRVLRDGSRGLEFVNELMRAQVYAALPSPVRKALHAAVADRLLGADRGIGHSSGLEVAWHSIRAGQPDQAIPHLLRGAKQAMRQGASHVAERALESALPVIEDGSSPEALLLLAEALQEQGRWQDSLDRVATLPPRCPRELHRRSVVLAASARLRLGSSLAEETRAQIPELVTILRESSDSRTRVTAARVVAHFASLDRDGEVARVLLPLVEAIPQDELDEDACGQMALTRGFLLYASGDVAASYSEVQRTSAAFERHGTVNTVAVELLIGLGVLKMHDGEYSVALAHFVRASELAARLGNDTLISGIVGNEAICLARLGEYSELLQLLRRSPQPWGVEFAGFVEIQFVYGQALAHIMQGNVDVAMPVIDQLDRRLKGPVSRWVVQAWLLWKADLLFLAGREPEAYSTGARAVSDFEFTLLSPALAGPFARWLGKFARSSREGTRAETCLRDLVDHVESYDALDQVEIAAAGLLVTPSKSADRNRVTQALANRLQRLPPATVNQLSRLGAL
jgi:type II secretory pathway predicted ATPase ExeA